MTRDEMAEIRTSLIDLFGEYLRAAAADRDECDRMAANLALSRTHAVMDRYRRAHEAMEEAISPKSAQVILDALAEEGKEADPLADLAARQRDLPEAAAKVLRDGLCSGELYETVDAARPASSVRDECRWHQPAQFGKLMSLIGSQSWHCGLCGQGSSSPEPAPQTAEGTGEPLQETIEQVRAEKHAAYAERNQLVAALSRFWPSHLALHPADDLAWDDEWRTIVCIHSPVGQLSWHIKTSEVRAFSHLKMQANDWDGHSTPEKYARLSHLTPPAPPAPATWQTIETAPKDGTYVLLRLGHEVPDVGKWFQTAVHDGWWVCHAIRVFPLHWMPLPAPPGDAP